jgi:hypothetical protein
MSKITRSLFFEGKDHFVVLIKPFQELKVQISFVLGQQIIRPPLFPFLRRKF